MNRRLPPLNSLKTFEAIGRKGSIAGAARELSVTEPAVSRALKNLENHFGVALFHRHTRGLELTEQGKLMLPQISLALDTVARVSGLVYEQSNYGLSILGTPMITSHWLAPIIGDFMRKHKNISVNLHSSFRPDELQNYNFDIAIWNVEAVKHNCDREQLFSLNRIPVCSADAADTDFPTGKLADLETAQLLHEYDYAGWTDFFEREGLDPRLAPKGVVSDNFNAILQATIAGAGTALLFEAFIDDPLYSGRLHTPFGRDRFVETPYWLYTREDVVDDKPIRLMKAFLKARLGKA
jgi:LysR family glycine cleavage system transcriptional activator